MSKLPFEGIRVADFGWVIAAPACTLWLANMGAEVIKIETKAHPETLRTINHGGYADGVPGLNRAGGFNSLNYSKYSCSLDLTRPRARELAKEIIKKSDVVVEAYTGSVAERFGLTYPELQAVKPDIILLSISSLGKTGPLWDATGFGPANQAYASLPSMTGYEGSIGSNMGGTWPDYLVGIACAYLAVAGLYYRRRTGRGLHLDLSMVQVVLNMIPGQLLDYQMNGRIAQPQGNRDPMAAPHGVYRCLGDDKWVAIAVQDEEQWRALCRAAGHPEWEADDRFADLSSRQRNQHELDALITQWTLVHTATDVMEKLQKVGVAAGPSQNSRDLINDPQLRHRNQFIEMDHPEAGRRLTMAAPALFSAIPERRYFPAPLLDQHNRRVFGELLGMSQQEIDSLTEAGVIF